MGDWSGIFFRPRNPLTKIIAVGGDNGETRLKTEGDFGLGCGSEPARPGCRCVGAMKGRSCGIKG